MIDLPRKKETEKNEKSTHFYRDLVYFLRASNLKGTVIEKLSWFDFSQTANIGFVHTMYVPIYIATYSYRDLTNSVVAHTVECLGDGRASPDLERLLGKWD